MRYILLVSTNEQKMENHLTIDSMLEEVNQSQDDIVVGFSSLNDCEFNVDMCSITSPSSNTISFTEETSQTTTNVENLPSSDSLSVESISQPFVDSESTLTSLNLEANTYQSFGIYYARNWMQMPTFLVPNISLPQDSYPLLIDMPDLMFQQFNVFCQRPYILSIRQTILTRYYSALNNLKNIENTFLMRCLNNLQTLSTIDSLILYCKFNIKLECEKVLRDLIRRVSQKSINDRIRTKGKGHARRLPDQSTRILKKWYFDHRDHPYPSKQEKEYLMSSTGLNLKQITNWFINKRVRSLNRAKPSS